MPFMPSVIYAEGRSAKCRSAECRSAKFCSAECRSAECHSTECPLCRVSFILNVVLPNVSYAECNLC